jgi:hypothetical protein
MTMASTRRCKGCRVHLPLCELHKAQTSLGPIYVCSDCLARGHTGSSHVKLRKKFSLCLDKEQPSV